MAEQVLLLENIGTSLLVGESQLPSLHALMLSASAILEMAPPDLYIKSVCAWTLGLCRARFASRTTCLDTFI